LFSVALLASGPLGTVGYRLLPINLDMTSSL
jgi:hypothetical protein